MGNENQHGSRKYAARRNYTPETLGRKITPMRLRRDWKKLKGLLLLKRFQKVAWPADHCGITKRVTKLSLMPPT